MIEYLGYSTFSLALSLLIYELLLRRAKTFKFNRFYLLGTLLLCLITPVLNIETSWEMVPQKNLSAAELIENVTIVNESENGVTIETISSPSMLEWLPTLLITLYLIISTILAVRFFRNLIRMSQNAKSSGVVVNDLKLVFTNQDIPPFSYFNFLFIRKSEYDSGNLSSSIIRHEKAHAQQLHSIDVIFIELIMCFFWFNPIVWLYRKLISENHEYLADNYAINEGLDLKTYATEIIKISHQTKPSQLASGFSYLSTKKRLQMLKRTKPNQMNRTIKITAVLLLVTTQLILNSFTYVTESQPLRVVIDAGHGGEDDGLNEGSFDEKDVTLSISKLISQYSEVDNIEIFLTRKDDEFMSLSDRVEFINKLQPDLFVSLHINSSEERSIGGVEAYYYEGDHSTASKSYSKILVSEQLESFNGKGKIKTASFMLLKNTDTPGVLLELGFFSNQHDREFLKDEKNHKKIATSLYNSLINISKLQK